MSEKKRAVLKKAFDPGVLDGEEAALSRSFVTESWKENTDPTERQKAMDAAKLGKSERTNIRLSEADLVGIKLKAHEKGLGYQTLIASLVHRYVSGNLVEMDPAVQELAARVAVLAVTRTVKRKGSKSLAGKRHVVASGLRRKKKPAEKRARRFG